MDPILAEDNNMVMMIDLDKNFSDNKFMYPIYLPPVSDNLFCTEFQKLPNIYLVKGASSFFNFDV